MPRIFDNIQKHLLPILTETLQTAYRADFCVGYFNLRGWRELSPCVEHFTGGEGVQARLLVGMQGRIEDDLHRLYRLKPTDDGMDLKTAVQLKRKAAEQFRQQLMLGAPTDADEAALRALVRQMQAGQVVVKLYLRHPLHAKLYLAYRHDANNPITAFLGSSNLTFAGLQGQGELNVDVVDHDATMKLQQWFQDRWADQFCLDITADLIAVIEESWAREALIPPYEIYLKIAYHLSQEARAGLSEFELPKDFAGILFDYQAAAVKIAAHHLNKRGGVLLGDVVGLGKTLMAAAVARIYQDDHNARTLIICPPNLEKMWRSYIDRYNLTADTLSLGKVTAKELEQKRRYQLIIVDESHNFRNRESKRYAALKDYINQNESRVILLSATPYNMSFSDLSAQLALFVGENQGLGIRPEEYIKEAGGETKFISQHQAAPDSLKAFEFSTHIEDWRELMRLYMVRRTRSFIMDNYAHVDPSTGRRYLHMHTGDKFYFPHRIPKNATFNVGGQYGQLYSTDVVDKINSLSLPRYGLSLYVERDAEKRATPAEVAILRDLSRAGKRLMGFSRTGLFKRLESSGAAFLQSLDRHILRNYIFLYALQGRLPLPIGTLDASAIDVDQTDQNDQEALDEDLNGEAQTLDLDAFLSGPANPYAQRAENAYQALSTQYKTRYKWIDSKFFRDNLQRDLREDADILQSILTMVGAWRAEEDQKINTLAKLIDEHAGQKILIFSQFADTVRYLYEELSRRGVQHIGMATGTQGDPTELARRFSPLSNGVNPPPAQPLRILIATDVLSEGQNLQDAHIIVNYDLPWAIIRLVQRAGRVDRIGQKSEKILCYSFLPADGVEEIIRLRARVRQRLYENGEVVGSDERFFEDDQNDADDHLRDLYTEKSGILDAEPDSEVDLASYAYQIWLNATKNNADLANRIAAMPNVVYSARAYEGSERYPKGVLVYLKTADGTDSLAWVGQNGERVTQSQLAILRAAECAPETPALPRHPDHHSLVQKGAEFMLQEEMNIGGQLGRPNNPRRKAYETLKAYRERLNKEAPLLVPRLDPVIDDLYHYPLLSSAAMTIKRMFQTRVSAADLAERLITMREDGRLSQIVEADQHGEPYILCSLGLV